MNRVIPNSLKRANLAQMNFFICDIQEVFRPLIYNMPAVIHNAEFLNKVCSILQIPTYVTEQYPKAMGSTVPEITRTEGMKIFPKTQFSMMIPELRAELSSTRKQVF